MKFTMFIQLPINVVLGMSLRYRSIIVSHHDNNKIRIFLQDNPLDLKEEDMKVHLIKSNCILYSFMKQYPQGFNSSGNTHKNSKKTIFDGCFLLQFSHFCHFCPITGQMQNCNAQSPIHLINFIPRNFYFFQTLFP